MASFLRRYIFKRVARSLRWPSSMTDSSIPTRPRLSVAPLEETIQLKSVTKMTKLSQAQFQLMLRGIDAVTVPSDGETRQYTTRELLHALQQAVTDPTIAVSVSGGKVMVKVDQEVMTKEVLREVREAGDTYGYGSLADRSANNNTNIVVEFSSPNIAKPFHFGHLRSTIIGNFISTLYEKLGYNVTRLNYLGDWGTQFGLLAIGYGRYGDEKKLLEDPMQHLFEVYVKVNKDVTWEKEKSLSDESETQRLAMQAFHGMEQGDKKLLALWKRFRDMSLTEYEKSYERLGVKFTEYHSESMYRDTESFLSRLTDAGHLIRDSESEPAYMEVDLEKRKPWKQEGKLSKVIIQKSDGSSLYITRDIMALLHRLKKYNFAKIHYVVENSQDQHFLRLSRAVEKITPDVELNLNNDLHIKFGRVEGMSTRRGDVVFLKDILDEAEHRMVDTMNSKNTTKVSGSADVSAVADVLGISSIIVEDMSQKRTRSYTFSWERAINFKADSGIMLQYAHARLCSLEANCGVDLEDTYNPTHLCTTAGQVLVVHIARYEDVVQMAFSSLEPVHIVKYLFQLCHFVNSAYGTMYVKGESSEKAQAHLHLYRCSRITLANGMVLLGLRPLQKM